MPRHNHRFVPAFLNGAGARSDQPVLFVRPMSERCAVVVSLKKLVEEVLGSRLRETASDHGGYSYDPCGLFLVLMFGYMQGTRSSRRLEESCRFDCRYEYLSDGLEPDHATFARFRRRMGKELEDLFLLVCQEAEARGILERRAMVVDGTKVAAARSQWQRALKEAEETDLWEEEARTMFTRNHFLIGYNLQVAADGSSGMIVGYVATNSENDQNQMPAVVGAVERQSGGLPEKAVTDRGYDSSQNAQALADAGVQGVLPKARNRPTFKVDAEGRVVCPVGHVATKMRKTSTSHGPRILYRVYRCKKCDMNSACGIKGNRRDYTVAADAQAVHRIEANAICDTEEGKRLLRVRGPTIERIFGQFKENQGFRRLVLRGLPGAAIELGLMALSYNLRYLI